MRNHSSRARPTTKPSGLTVTAVTQDQDITNLSSKLELVELRFEFLRS